MRVPKFSSVLWMSGVLSGMLAGIASFHIGMPNGLILGIVTLFLLAALGPGRSISKPVRLAFAISGFALTATGTLLLDVASYPSWAGPAIIIAALSVAWLLDELENR